MDRLLIDRVLERINKAYQPGALAYLKTKRPEEWRKMIACESEIDRAAIQCDEVGLGKALNEYEAFILEMVKTFRTPKGETGNLF